MAALARERGAAFHAPCPQAVAPLLAPRASRQMRRLEPGHPDRLLPGSPPALAASSVRHFPPLGHPLIDTPALLSAILPVGGPSPVLRRAAGSKAAHPLAGHCEGFFAILRSKRAGFGSVCLLCALVLCSLSMPVGALFPPDDHSLLAAALTLSPWWETSFPPACWPDR